MKAKQLIVRRAGILTATAAIFSLIVWSGNRSRWVGTPPENSGASSLQTPSAAATPRASAKLDPAAIPPQKYVNGGTRFTSPVPEGLSGPEWDSIRAQIEDSEYAFQLAEGADRAHAANREQRIKASLDATGVRVTPYVMNDGEPTWQWSLQTLTMGAAGEAIPLATASRTTASGRRAEVARGIVTEWCDNQRAGVEQGFTIHQAPASTAPSDGKLRLNFRCETTLKLKEAGPTSVHWMDESGEVALRYSGLYAYDANAIRVPAEFHIETDDPARFCIALNTEGAAYPITIDPLIATKQQKLTPWTGPTDHFGFAVAMHGDVCVIGAPPDDPAAVNPTVTAGVVHIFVRDAATRAWQQLAHLSDPLPNSNRAFGAALDWNGHTLVIGSPAFQDLSAPAPAGPVGAHVLTWAPATGYPPGARVDLVDPEGASQSSGFGEAVAISGTGIYVAVGSPRAYLGGAQSGGRVMIYPQLPNGSYATTPSPLHNTWGNQVGAGWGKRLSFDKRGSSRLAVGSPGYNQPAFPNGGRVLVLDVAEDGVNETTITPFSQGYHTLGHFGSDVSLNGKRLAVGHPGASISFLDASGIGLTVPTAGFVHVYELGTQWEEIEGIPSPDPQSTGFGRRVSLDDDRLVVDSDSLSHGFEFHSNRWIPTFRYPDFVILGASSHPSVIHGDQFLYGNTGEVFLLQGNGWCHLIPEYLAAASTGERRGMAMAGARDFMVAGSPNYSPSGQVNRGLASVITFAPSGQPVMAPLASGAPAGAEAGSSVATDGHRIAVGAPGTAGGTGAVSLFEPNGIGGWTENNGVTNPDVAAGAGDRFGSAIAIDGDRLVVGAALDSQYGFLAGRAWVFQRDPAGSWSNPTELKPTTEGGVLGAFDLFGWAVDIEGDRIVVSEPGDDQAGSAAGAVHVFEWHGTSWDWTGKGVPESSDYPSGVEGNLGFSVAIKGDRIAAGAPTPIISPGSGAGSVSVFARSAGSSIPGHPDPWGRIARIVPADSANDDEFGLAVQWRAEELIIGSGQSDRIHFYTGGNGGSVWTETSRILNPLATAGEGFGRSFAVTRDELAAGVPFANSESGELVFFRQPGAWHPMIAWQRQGDDGLGSALAIDGDTAVIGADRHTIPGAVGTEHGGAYVIVRNPDGNWNTDTEILTAGVEDPGARFGAAVAIDGDRILVGAPLHIDAGAVWSFARQHDGSWLIMRLPAATTAGDQFGAAVDLDGNLALIGAPLSSTHGKAHVYRFATGNLTPQLVKSLDAPTTSPQNLISDPVRFGASVSLEGDILAVGAPGYDLASLDSGIVAIHQRNRGGLEQWGLARTVDGLPSSAVSGFGESLDVDGNWLIVGAPSYQLSPGVSTGAAHLFRRDAGGLGNWGRSQFLLPHDPVDGLDFGRAVAIADEWIAVASPGLTLNGSPSGGVEMFLFGGSEEMPVERGMLLPGQPTSSGFGSSLALGSRTLLVGEQLGAVPATSTVAIYLLADHRQRWGFDQFGPEVFSLANEATIWGDLADYDRDGLSTILEYLMGTNPLARQSDPSAGVPFITYVVPQKFLRLRYRQASYAVGSTYSLIPEWSPDLVTWYPSGDGPVGNQKTIEKVMVMADDEDPHAWIIDAMLPLSPDEPKAFMRLTTEKHDSP